MEKAQEYRQRTYRIPSSRPHCETGRLPAPSLDHYVKRSLQTPIWPGQYDDSTAKREVVDRICNWHQQVVEALGKGCLQENRCPTANEYDNRVCQQNDGTTDDVDLTPATTETTLPTSVRVMSKICGQQSHHMSASSDSFFLQSELNFVP